MSPVSDTRDPREVVDADGLRWTCIQAFAGLGLDPAKQEAAEVDGSTDVHVVCTPSGGARSRRLRLPADWARSSDDDLVAAISAGGDARAE